METVTEIYNKYIINNWNSLKSGEVIDVEFILKETSTKKISEEFEGGYL